MPSLDGNPVGLPQTTRSGIYYEIDALNPHEQWVPGGSQVAITCRVLTDDAETWAIDMVGKTRFNGGAQFARDLPEPYPFANYFYCTKVEQIDQGGLNDEGTFADAGTGWPFTKWQRFRCTFEGLPYLVIPDSALKSTAPKELQRYTIRQRRVYIKEQQIPGGGFKIIDDVTPANRKVIAQVAFKTVAFADIQYTVVRWPVVDIPTGSTTTQMGTINNATFDTIGDGAYFLSAGSLLFSGFDDRNRYYDAAGDWVVDMVYSFRWNSNGWNKFINSTGGFTSVSSDGTSGGTKPYTTSDFALLFVPSG